MKCTVCIPTLNAAENWASMWSALQAQTLPLDQIIIIDSSSTDKTAALAEEAGCRVIIVPRAEFRHGGTRQYAAELAPNSDVIIYLTQDSILAEPHSLGRLVTVFDDPRVGAAYGRQLPRRGAGPIEAHARLFNYPEKSKTHSSESAGAVGFRAVFLSNSFAAYRSAALSEAGGFPRNSNFGEDTVVAARMLNKGWRIAYMAEAQTWHSHGHSLAEEFRRYRHIGQLHQSEPWLLEEFGRPTGEGLRFVKSEIRYLSAKAPWLIPEAILRTGLKYFGYRRGRRDSTHVTGTPINIAR